MEGFIAFSMWSFLIFGTYLVLCGTYKDDRRDGMLLVLLSLILFLIN